MLLFVLVFALCLSVTASAANYETGWGTGLDNNDVEARALMKRVASQICSPGDSDYEKVRKLNKYVCDNAKYDYDNASDSLTDFVFKNKAVCSGYAEALAYLLDCVNVKNFKVTAFVYTSDNSGSLHIWNTVYIDGKWLHVDPTWNDATRDEENPNGKYFLSTGDEISVNRQKLSFITTEDYNKFYHFIKTITISFKSNDTLIISNGVKQDFAKLDNIVKDDPEPATYVPANTEVFAVQDGRILVPVRDIAYALGGYVKQEDSGKVTIILGTKTLMMTTGSNQGYIDGEEFTFDVAPQIINGKIMIPAWMAFEKLGATLRYDDATSEVTISYDPYIAS